jgi:hypothetical protein
LIESDFYEETNCFGADHQIEVGDKCEKDKEAEEVTKFSVKYVIAKVPLLTEFFICVTFTTFCENYIQKSLRPPTYKKEKGERPMTTKRRLVKKKQAKIM